MGSLETSWCQSPTLRVQWDGSAAPQGPQGPENLRTALRQSLCVHEKQKAFFCSLWSCLSAVSSLPAAVYVQGMIPPFFSDSSERKRRPPTSSTSLTFRDTMRRLQLSTWTGRVWPCGAGIDGRGQAQEGALGRRAGGTSLECLPSMMPLDPAHPTQPPGLKNTKMVQITEITP